MTSRVEILCVAIALAMLCGTPVHAQPDVSGDWDVVVVGGGLMGSSTAWQLARAGQRVLLLEKQGPVYTRGSSYGEARISRSLGPPGDIWSYMHNRTVREVKELVELLNDHGEAADMGDVYSTSPVNYVRHIDRLEGYEWLSRQPDRYEVATTPDAALASFGLKLPADAFIVREYKEFSGTIDPSAVIPLLHKGTTLLGGKVAYEQHVTRLERKGGGFELSVTDVTTGRAYSIAAPKVVSAAGPFTGQLLRGVAPDFDRLITPQRVFLAFFEVAPEFWNRLSPSEQSGLRDLFPGINSTAGTRASGSFSMIERDSERETPIIKIGGHFQRSDIQDLDTVWNESLTDGEEAWAREALLRHLSLLDIGFADEHLLLESSYSCVYSLTESEVPYVTHAPRTDGSVDPNLVVVGGLSGVGAKGSLAYGVIATDLLLGRSEDDPVYIAAREAFGYERMRRDALALAR